MATYDDAGDTYEQATWTYQGYPLTGDSELLLDGVGVPETAYEGPKLAVGTGTSLGTLDARTIDLVPSLGQQLAAYLNATTLLWDGTVAAVETDEFLGGHTFSTVNGQQAAWPGGTPTASPWDLSDTPNLSTTFPYVKLSERKYLNDGVEETGYTVVVDKTGLWRNMTIEVTSANFGLSAQTFLIVDVNLEWQTPDAPRYTLLLDVSQPQLPEMIDQAADDAAALALETGTVHFVENTPATVIVDEDGITVTDGAITVSNPGGTVVIDGTSDMFRIVATGTLTTTSFSNPGESAIATVLVMTGFQYAPATMTFWTDIGGGTARPVEHVQIGSGSAAHVDWQWRSTCDLGPGGVNTDISVRVASSIVGGTTPGYVFRWYMFEQGAI